MRAVSQRGESNNDGTSGRTVHVLHLAANQGDEVLVRSALRRSRHAEFVVSSTLSLDEAMAQALSGTADVILVDCALAGHDGSDVLATLLPVCGVAVVGYQHDEHTDAGLLETGLEDVVLHRDLASAWLGRVLFHAVARHGLHSELEASEQRLRQELDAAKRTRELEQRLVLADRLASVGLLAAGVAHEINNPLTYVQLNLSWLLDRINALEGQIEPALVDEMRATMTENQEGMDHIREVVKDLSSFARAGGDKIVELDLADIVRSACNLVRNELRHRAELVLDLEPCPLIVGERSRLIQLTVNLLVNAAHAVDDGDKRESRVTVRSGQTDDGVGLVVEDSGCGIPPENLARIFEPFFTTRSQGRGTGLGLSLCAETARRHQGSLTVTSRLGQGSRFTLSLPLETGLVVSTPSGPQRPITPERSLRVLVVDDEQHVGTALQRAMTPSHQVLVTTDGGEALRQLAQDAAFDAILCDVMMPVVDGPRFYAALSQEHPDLVQRVVFLTGEAFTPRARAFLSAVPNRVIKKPVRIDTVVDALARAAGTSEDAGW